MKWTPVFLLFTVCCISCNSESEKRPATGNTQPDQAEHAAFFPVTDFLLGQIAEIRSKGINPIKTTTINGKQDSVWVKTETLAEELSPFLSPVIDSNNLTGMFTEKRFLDQTLAAFTFTYDPVKILPDSFMLQRWDVYVDQESNTVNRIYMVKKTKDRKTLLLTWQTGKSCKIVTISSDNKGIDHVEKEVSIKWDF